MQVQGWGAGGLHLRFLTRPRLAASTCRDGHLGIQMGAALRTGAAPRQLAIPGVSTRHATAVHHSARGCRRHQRPRVRPPTGIAPRRSPAGNGLDPIGGKPGGKPRETGDRKPGTDHGFLVEHGQRLQRDKVSPCPDTLALSPLASRCTPFCVGSELR